jgi:hypothetical protein
VYLSGAACFLLTLFVRSTSEPISRNLGASYAFFTANSPFSSIRCSPGTVTWFFALSSESPLGAYGFRLLGMDGGAGRLIEAPEHWPDLLVEHVPYAESPAQRPGTTEILADAATVWLPRGERIELQRAEGIIRLVTRSRPSAEVVVHPLLGLPAAIMSMWLGRLSLHGGAFSCRGGSWALLGDRGAGKSTTLAQLLALDHVIVSDDLLMIQGSTLYCGPRSIDLRSEAADVLGGEPMGILGSRARWRLRPGPTAPETPISGFVKLEWGEDVLIEPLDARERLELLHASSAVYPRPEDAAALLELLVLPVWRFTRPNDLAQGESALAQLIDVLGG